MQDRRRPRPAVHARLRLLLAAIVMSAGSQAGAAAVTVEPAFGYQIGDSIVAVARVTIDEQAQLDAESLPKIGRLHGWLSLEALDVTPEPGGLRITRVFQVTASAPEPKMLFLPKVELKFKLGGRELAEQLESVPISVAPLATAEPILRTGFGALRPDRDAPDPRPGDALRRATWLASVLGVLALLWFGLRALAVRRRGYAPFALAAGRLRRLARRRHGQDAQEQALGQAFRIMHDAFNDAAGQAVFSSQRERFLVEHPQFTAEAGRVRTFFDCSDALFFGGRADGIEMRWLVDLARRLARLERPGR